MRTWLRRSGHLSAGAVIHPPERSFSTEVVKSEQHASTRRARARATRKNRGVLSRPGSGRSARACVPAEGVTAARNAPLGAGVSGTKAIYRSVSVPGEQNLMTFPGENNPDPPSSTYPSGPLRT